MNALDDTPRQGRKVQQVLAGARTVFMRDGFEGASVDAIAREAGVSKATLYSYFADKRVLFMEVGRSQCAHQSGLLFECVDTSAPAREVLSEIGRRVLGFMRSGAANARTSRACCSSASTRARRRARCSRRSGAGCWGS